MEIVEIRPAIGDWRIWSCEAVTMAADDKRNQQSQQGSQQIRQLRNGKANLQHTQVTAPTNHSLEMQ